MTETTTAKVREEQVTDLTAENAHRVTMVREKGTDHPPVPFHFRKEHHGMHHFVHLYGNPEDRNELHSSNFKDWEAIAFKHPGYLEDMWKQACDAYAWSSFDRKYSINSLVYWVTYVHNVVYSFYRSMIYCYINSTQRCAGSIVIDIIPTNGADKRKFFPFAPYFPVTNVIKRYFYPYFPAIIGIKGYSFPYFPYLSGIMKIKTALYSLFSRLDWHKTVVFPCLGEIYEGIRSLSWEIPVT